MTSKILKRIGLIYSKAMEWIAAIILLMVTVAMLETAFSRTFFNTPWSALDRIDTIAIIWACFIISGLMIERDEHISVNFFITKLKGLRLLILKLIIHIIVLIGYCIIAYYGYQAFQIIYDTGVFYPAEIDIPQWLAVFPIFLGMVLGIPFVIHVVVKDIIQIHNAVAKKVVKGDIA
jgi:TRAP-type C4-dicarboxylate transport system permease small subunit